MTRFLLLASLLFVINYSYSQDTFRDEFGTVSYGNNDGVGGNWAGNWVEIEPFGTDNDPANDYVFIDAVNNRLEFFWIWTETLTRTADLSGYASAVLSFDWETVSLEANEEMSIQVSDDGINFDTLDSFGDNNNTTGTFSENITAYISANTTIRFINTNANWSNDTDVFRADNVQIEAFASDFPPVIVVTGDDEFCPNASNSIPIVDTISITDPDDTELDQLTIQISTGYDNGADLLTLSGTHPNITDTWNVTEGRLTLTGPALLSEFEAAVLAVEYSASPPPANSGLREFSIVLGSPLFLPETGHYYEFIASPGIRWDDARDEAALREFFGYEGYMATLTSATEAAFAGDQITGTGWIGASDAFGSGEGDWRWETGPEAGTSFWVGDERGAVVPGEFAFWNGGEPNNVGGGGEDYAHITDDTIGINNSWNDLPIAGGGGAYAAQGYIVEYGGLPSDPVLQISGVTTLRLGCSVITNRRQTYRVGY